MASHPFEEFPAEIWLCISQLAHEFERRMMKIVFHRSPYRFPCILFEDGGDDHEWRQRLDDLMKHDRSIMPCMDCGEIHRISGPVRCYHRPVCEGGKSSWQPFPPAKGFNVAVPRFQHNLLRALQWLSTSGCKTRDLGAVEGLLASVNKRVDADLQASLSGDAPPIHVRLAVWKEEVLAEVWTERTVPAGKDDEETRKLIDTGRGYRWFCCSNARTQDELFHGCWTSCPLRMKEEFVGQMVRYRPFDCGRGCQQIPTVVDRLRRYSVDDSHGWGSGHIEPLTKTADFAVVEGSEVDGGVVHQIRRQAHSTCGECYGVHYMQATETKRGELKIRTGIIRSTDNDVMVTGDTDFSKKHLNSDGWPMYKLFRIGWWSLHSCNWGSRGLSHWRKLYDKSLDPRELEEPI